jgi:hypothetical protein
MHLCDSSCCAVLQVHAEQLTTTAVAAEAAEAAVDIVRVASSTGPHPAAAVAALSVPGSSVVSPPLLAAAPGMQVRLRDACRTVGLAICMSSIKGAVMPLHRQLLCTDQEQ